MSRASVNGESSDVLARHSRTDARPAGIGSKTPQPTGQREPERSSKPITRSSRARLLPAVGLIVLGVLSLAAFARPEPEPPEARTSRTLGVRVVVARPVQAYQAVRAYTGTIVARRVSALGFELPGTLMQLHVAEGDPIAAGAILAQIDPAHLRARRRQTVARRTQAAARLAEIVAGPRAEDIAAARARVESLESQVELLELQTARQKRLLVHNATSQDAFEQSTFGRKTREADLNEARHRLQELLNGTRHEQIDAQRAVVAELDAAIADIDVDLRNSRLIAPFDGTIARRLADEGTVVQAGQPVFRLVEDQVLDAWIGLPSDVAGRLTPGSRQRLKIHGEYFEASVAGRFPEVDPATRTRTVVLRLAASAARRVVHGEIVRLELEETIQTEGFWLPSTALTKGARGLWTALVVEEEAAHARSQPPGVARVARRELEVLHTASDRVLVRGTLRAGDQVIANGTHRVVVGQRVRVLPPVPGEGGKGGDGSQRRHTAGSVVTAAR